METIELLPWVERIGIASVLLLVGSAFAWRVLVWVGRRVDKWFDAQLDLMATLQENDSKHTEALQAIATNDKHGHDTTHRKLDVIHEDVKRLAGPTRESS